MLPRNRFQWCWAILLAASAAAALWHLGIHRAVLGQAPAEPAKRLALLVGINRYEHAKLDKLSYAVNDVTELGKVLSAAGYEVTLLTDDAGEKDAKLAPTKANIEKYLH